MANLAYSIFDVKAMTDAIASDTFPTHDFEFPFDNQLYRVDMSTLGELLKDFNEQSPADESRSARIARIKREIEPIVVQILTVIKGKEQAEGMLAGIPAVAPTHYKWFAQFRQDKSKTDQIAGAFMIIGMTRAGKSEYLFGQGQPDIVFRHNEPFEVYDVNSDVVHITGFPATLLGAVVANLLGARSAIDSMRGVVSGLSGSAREGGVLNRLFPTQTGINNIFANFACVIPVVLNPMVQSVDALRTIFDDTGSSVSAMVLIDDAKVVGSEIRSWSGRLVEPVSQESWSLLGSRFAGSGSMWRDPQLEGPRSPVRVFDPSKQAEIPTVAEPVSPNVETSHDMSDLPSIEYDDEDDLRDPIIFTPSKLR